MTRLPLSWAELRARRENLQRVQQIIEWDGVATSQSITLPVLPSLRPVKIVVDNARCQSALSMKLEEHVRTRDANAGASIGEGEDGVVTISVDEPGASGNAYSIEVVLPTEANVDMSAVLDEGVITVTLGTDSEGDPDPSKNTAELIAAEIDDIEGFSAVASGDGSGVFDTAIAPVQFAGGTVEVWAEHYDPKVPVTWPAIAAGTTVSHGPIEGFPRFLDGRIVLEAESAPADGDTTIVHVQEV